MEANQKSTLELPLALCRDNTSWRITSTPFGLYRDGTELRGVYYSKPEVAREACFSLGSQCDYPILMGACLRSSCTRIANGVRIGNDPLYGGK